jgi:hypothetical protein
MTGRFSDHFENVLKVTAGHPMDPTIDQPERTSGGGHDAVLSDVPRRGT